MKTLVLCDTGDFVGYQRFENSILNCLDFYQFLYQPIDISYTLIDSIELDDVNLMIIAQEGTGKKLGPADWRIVFKNVSSGMGLVIFDGMINSYQEFISQYTGLSEFIIGKTNEIILEESWINSISAEKIIRLKVPALAGSPSFMDGNWHVFLRDHQLNPIGMWRNLGKGKITILSISQSIWHKSCLGHGGGFDSIFWRTLVHTAKKPFVFKGVPPFITCRINDATGKSECDSPIKKFAYGSILSEAGFIPHIGLCINEVKQDSFSHIRQLHHQAKAEFSAHAFYQTSHDRDPSIYLGSDGREFSFEQLETNFKQIDKFFSSLSINVAKTINAHRSQIGYNSIGFFKSRGQLFAMNLLKIGKIFSDSRSLMWEPKPFGIPNFCVDYLDDNNEIFNVVSHPGQITNSGVNIDFLQSFSSIQQAAEKGIFQIKRGLENLTFGCLMFHERNLRGLTIAEFETITSIIANEIKKFPHIFKSYDYVSSYLKNRQDSKIVSLRFQNSHLQIVLSGKSTMDQFVWCFTEKENNIMQIFLEIPPFEKSLEVVYRLQNL
ncbi:MAG: hypothetical protein NC906_01925 [Candidatus Omnitrophica bacterium]|nr:hypothetical protein [Candidatus Omnitrophota bacterium]